MEPRIPETPLAAVHGTVHRLTSGSTPADFAARWRIVKEAPREDDTPARFAVLRGEQRVAWGLRDRAAAARWLRRLSAPQSLSV